MIVKDILIAALEQLGYESGKTILQQGSIAQDEPYPESFFTFWNNDSQDDVFLDNNPNTTVWTFTLAFYSENPILVNTELTRAKPILKQAGFIVIGKGSDAWSDEKSHLGREISLIYIEQNQ